MGVQPRTEAGFSPSYHARTTQVSQACVRPSQHPNYNNSVVPINRPPGKSSSIFFHRQGHGRIDPREARRRERPPGGGGRPGDTERRNQASPATSHRLNSCNQQDLSHTGGRRGGVPISRSPERPDRGRRGRILTDIFSLVPNYLFPYYNYITSVSVSAASRPGLPGPGPPSRATIAASTRRPWAASRSRRGSPAPNRSSMFR